MKQLPIFFGVLRYEFRMQIHRRALWFAILCFIILFVIRGPGAIFHELITNIYDIPMVPLIATWTSQVNTFLPIAVGVLLADRLWRDKRTKVDELFSTMPGSLSTRLLGKYLGSTLATLLPIFLFYSFGIGFIYYKFQNPIIIPVALATFAAIILPGILFISAFSIACPTIIWLPLYQFLFVGYWFWGNLLSPRNGIPTLSNTILTPYGGYMSTGFFGAPFSMAGATPLEGTASILLLLSITMLVMYLLWGLLRWQQARQ